MSETSWLKGDYLPKLVTVLAEGYDLRALRADAMAGLTVAIVALPLSMAIAIASGLGPERGLFTAILGGFLISALGGSRYQIGGPAGAFIVGVSGCLHQLGEAGLMTATFLTGLILIAASALRLGRYIRFLPYPVTVGFTTGIAVIIFCSQIKGLTGITLPAAEPPAVLDKLAALWAARGSFNPQALGLALATVIVLQTIKAWRPAWPNMLIAVLGMSLAAHLAGLQVELVADRFGPLPRFLPAPLAPDLSLEMIKAALPFALQFSLLGAITGLLSAEVADGLSGKRHRPTVELFAEGAANVAVSFFGGVVATGAVARTVTNHNSGAHGPVAGMLHSVFVLGFMLTLAPWVGFVPIAVFAGLLAVVAWNMAARAQFAMLMRVSRADGVVVCITFLMVVFRDLTEGIVLGFALSALVFLQRIATTVEILADDPDAPDRVTVHMSGPWFFGAAAQAGAMLDQLARRPRVLVLELSALTYLDVSGARALELLGRRMAKQGGRMVLAGVRPTQRAVLEQAGLTPDRVEFLSETEGMGPG